MKSYPRPPKFQAAFTLLELIIVVVILAIMVSYIQTRPDTSGDYKRDSVVEQIISAGRLAQQLSMNDSSRTFLLQIQANQVNLLANGSPFVAGINSFPQSFGTQVTLSPITNISFDSLGRTTATTVTVSVGSTSQVCFQSSGYIQRC